MARTPALSSCPMIAAATTSTSVLRSAASRPTALRRSVAMAAVYDAKAKTLKGERVGGQQEGFSPSLGVVDGPWMHPPSPPSTTLGDAMQGATRRNASPSTPNPYVPAGEDYSLPKGKVCLITNVASACGYTASNYKES